VGNGIAPPCARAAENANMMKEQYYRTKNPTGADRNREYGEKLIANEGPQYK
jgi:hypothetical protein